MYFPDLYEILIKSIITFYFRVFFGSTPSLMISDPELMKNIMVKDFSKAPNRFVCRRHLQFRHSKHYSKVLFTKDVDAVNVFTFEGTNRTA